MDRNGLLKIFNFCELPVVVTTGYEIKFELFLVKVRIFTIHLPKAGLGYLNGEWVRPVALPKVRLLAGGRYKFHCPQ